jgi:DNA-binding NarL/FixJ family response regulator
LRVINNTHNPREDREGISLKLSRQAMRQLERLSQTRNSHSLADLAEQAIAWFGRLQNAEDMAAFAKLTPRLQEVLKLIGQGKTNKEIANALGVSVKTVEYHRGRLARTLGLNGVVELARFSIRVGLVAP